MAECVIKPGSAINNAQHKNKMDKNPAVAVLCGGGPAPGINTVLSTLAKLFIKEGYRVIGIHGAYKGLFSKDPEIIDFNLK